MQLNIELLVLTSLVCTPPCGGYQSLCSVDILLLYKEEICQSLSLYILYVKQCAKINLKLCLKAELVTVGVDATMYIVHCTVCLAFVYILYFGLKPSHILIHNIADAPKVRGSVFCRDSDYFWDSVSSVKVRI